MKKNILPLAALAILTAIAFLPKLASAQMMGWYYGYGNFPLGGILGMILMIIFWILIVVLIIAIIRRIAYGPHWEKRYGRRYWEDKDDESDSAMRILKERYAKGEINKDEFEQKKKDLL